VGIDISHQPDKPATIHRCVNGSNRRYLTQP
jgi:hypothetical protein